jgi:hypothetical protein
MTDVKPLAGRHWGKMASILGGSHPKRLKRAALEVVFGCGNFLVVGLAPKSAVSGENHG